ncbi:hypothetical protein [Borrelia miyamotoi]|uniref:Uncharacterized protein n=1 Tax=Borrelia miyamotoi TaxID=47466 RepID=A0AAQ3AHF1_9SPIR|nr:hypothetical protein [Borrelia miyamotoi]WAZ86034.1 hypothetical protein O5400_06730 [Borrelia miyamotoi]WAZ91817.1 hypothetical protein O5398_06740 [Borrelia miyamotoi]WAZ93109.1 hypothetical protein O5402_06775 [Borrelia miyamotoi]WAZ94402.1 hypothetical protein O5399_06775 [Borrelia miyamotoi]WAZ95685.1 hypothetical protein O5397_06750 [Borrelia miyamotoi]
MLSVVIAAVLVMCVSSVGIYAFKGNFKGQSFFNNYVLNLEADLR